MRKVIVTGASGFIGSELLKELSARGIESIAVVRSCNSNVGKIKDLPKVKIVYCAMENIRHLPELVTDRDIDTCFHLAWAGSFGEKRSCHEMQLRNTAYALHTVDAAGEMNVKRFVGAGTIAEKEAANYHSQDGAAPDAVSFYGIAKMAAHYMTKTECTRIGMEHVWCYLPNTFAVGSTADNFVMMACRLMLAGKRASFTDGEQLYDFLYVTDTVQALLCAADKGKTNTSYYLGSGKPRKLKEYIRMIRDAIDPGIELHLGDIPFHGKTLPPEEYDGNKLAEDTGFKPEIEFEEGVRRTVKWLRSLKI